MSSTGTFPSEYFDVIHPVLWSLWVVFLSSILLKGSLWSKDKNSCKNISSVRWGRKGKSCVMVGSFKNLFHFYLHVGTYVGDHSSQKRVRDPLQLELQEVVSFSWILCESRKHSWSLCCLCRAHWHPAFFCISILLKPECPSRENCVSHKYSLMSEAYSWRWASHWADSNKTSQHHQQQ